MTPSGLMTTNEAATFLGLGPDMVRKLVQQDRLPHLKLGYRTLKFRKSSLELWLARRERTPHRL